jgi:hypothetical protein
MEVEEKYLPLVQWDTLEDHIIGFRQPKKFQNEKITYKYDTTS